MDENNKVKIVGYAQRVFYNNGIEYRNFTEDLVGNQQTEGSDGNTSVFTFGNFVTTTNYGGRESRIYSTKKYSDYYCLENLGLNTSTSPLLINNNLNVTLNLDNTNLCNYAYFGSATEFIRVSLENIITKWPASLYVNPIRNSAVATIIGETVSDYVYDELLNKSTFKVDTNFIVNNFGVNYMKNGTTVEGITEENELRNFTTYYLNYVVHTNDTDYAVLNMTPSLTERNSYIYLEVDGNPFGSSTASTVEYHIRPNKANIESFFNNLDTFEDNLLNRLTTPKYTSKYEYKIVTESGLIVNKRQTLTWPVTDGYNIDFNSTSYVNYVTNLLSISTSKDGIETDLMTRFLTSESISDFDTVPRCDGTQEETAGQKMNKTLKIYGREFDEIKKYIDGISFANVVSYDKKNNTPDQLVKYLARVLGWELTSSLIENNLLGQYLDVSTRSYPGYSRGLTPNEAEVELWRRLILNSAWIWKSKGTRKSVEFFFNLIGTPDGLINFNEYVYVADAPIDMDIFYATLENNGLDSDLSNYTVDSDGYPKFLRDNRDMYFQKGGQWYRQTAGTGATVYNLQGNNPHVGPYDGGKEYINQLENIIPNFSAFTITATTVTSATTQLFTNYNRGVVNQYSGETFVGIQNDEGVDLTGVVTLNTYIQTDPCPIHETTDCGCDIPELDEALIIDVSKGDLSSLQLKADCDDKVSGTNFNEEFDLWIFDYILYDQYGDAVTAVDKKPLISKECCDALVGGNSFYIETYENNTPNVGFNTVNYDWQIVNAGYICCKSEGLAHDHGANGCGCVITCQWRLFDVGIFGTEMINNETYLKFIDPAGNPRVVNKSDSCFCPTSYTTPKVVLDPYTNEQGYACKLSESSIELMSANPTITNVIYRFYEDKANGFISCKGVPRIGTTTKK